MFSSGMPVGILPYVFTNATLQLPIMERNRNLAAILKYWDAFMPLIPHMESDPDDLKIHEELTRVFSDLGEAVGQEQAKREEFLEFLQAVTVTRWSKFLSLDLSKFNQEYEYPLYAAMILVAIDRAIVAHTRVIASQRVTTFGLTVLADQLEGKPTDDLTPPFNPHTGEPMIVEWDENIIIIKSGIREDYEVIMKIRGEKEVADE